MDERDERPTRYVEGEEEWRVVYRASGFGGCPKAIVAGASGYTPKPWPEWFEEVLNEGVEFEDEIIRQYEARTGWTVGARQGLREVSLGRIGGREVIVRGHIDGEADTGTVNPRLVEVKKVRDSQWGEFLRSGVEYLPMYPWQVSAYMFGTEVGLGIGQPGDGVTVDVVGGRLVEKDGVKEIVEIHVHTLTNPPIPLLAFKKKAALIEAAVAVEDITKFECRPVQYPCPFYYLHDPTDMEIEPPERLADSTAIQLAQEFTAADLAFKAAVDAATELERKKKAAQEGLLAWLKLNGQEGAKQVKVTEEDGTENVIRHVAYWRKPYAVQGTTVEYLTVKRDRKVKDPETGVKVRKPRAPRKKAT